jgi:hypothetical protein
MLMVWGLLQILLDGVEGINSGLVLVLLLVLVEMFRVLQVVQIKLAVLLVNIMLYNRSQLLWGIGTAIDVTSLDMG